MPPVNNNQPQRRITYHRRKEPRRGFAKQEQTNQLKIKILFGRYYHNLPTSNTLATAW